MTLPLRTEKPVEQVLGTPKRRCIDVQGGSNTDPHKAFLDVYLEDHPI